MTKATEAIFTGGVFRPTEPVDLREHQRVRLIVETIDGAATDVTSEADRATAIDALRAGIARMGFRSTGPYPTRSELHERR